MPFPPIRTPRLLIRPMTPGDAVAFAAYRDDPETARGYTLSPTSRGQGLATEAVSAVLERLRGTGIATYRASVDPANAGSIRLLDRLGFSYLGRTERSTLLHGEWVDDDHYELTY